MKLSFRILLAALLLGACNLSQNPNNQTSNGETTSNKREKDDKKAKSKGYKAVAKKYEEKKEHLTIDIDYLHFDHSYLDSLITSNNKSEINEIYQAYNEMLAEREKDEDAYQYENELNVEYKYSTYKNLVSIVKSSYTYLGGAHGMSITTTFVVNPQKRVKYSLSDFFNGDVLSSIREKVRAALVKELEFSDFIEDGTRSISDFSSFSLANDSITFYFNPYQVAPYYLGSPIVRLSTKDLPEFRMP